MSAHLGICKPHYGPAPCAPCSERAECKRCARHAPMLLNHRDRLRRTVVIDASTAKPNADGRCAMWSRQ